MKLKQYGAYSTLEQITEVTETNFNLLTEARDNGVATNYDLYNLKACSIILDECRKAKTKEQFKLGIDDAILEAEDYDVLIRLHGFRMHPCCLNNRR